MKYKILLIVISLILISLSSYSQWISPGNGSSFTLDDLVTISGGAVSLDGGDYYFNEAITISTSDTLYINNNGLLYINGGILWTIEGVLIANPPNQFEVKKNLGDANFQGIRFDNSPASSVSRLIVSGCGGIKLVDSPMEFRDCIFSDFGQEYSTSTINLFQSNPLIRDCSFSSNSGPAIGSGANGNSSPQIINNILNGNVTSNSNTPQINLGTSDGFESIIIDSNQVIGAFDNAGGIVVSTLAGGNANAIITNNEVSNNRYGIAMIGSNISSIISNNTIIGNNIQGDPMLGGSGLNFYGGITNTSIVSHNTISENLWGVTIQLNAQPNFGDGTIGSPGQNIIIDNQNNFQIYALYNNTPEEIMALNNFWGTTDIEVAETYIFHEVDDASLGMVYFDPMWINPVGLIESITTSMISIFPNPCSDYMEIHDLSSRNLFYEVFNIKGQLIEKGQLLNGVQRLSTFDWNRGTYFVKLDKGGEITVEKLMVW